MKHLTSIAALSMALLLGAPHSSHGAASLVRDFQTHAAAAAGTICSWDSAHGGTCTITTSSGTVHVYGVTCQSCATSCANYGGSLDCRAQSAFDLLAL